MNKNLQSQDHPGFRHTEHSFSLFLLAHKIYFLTNKFVINNSTLTLTGWLTLHAGTVTQPLSVKSIVVTPTAVVTELLTYTSEGVIEIFSRQLVGGRAVTSMPYQITVSLLAPIWSSLFLSKCY